jgi:hypothetical protein
VAATVKKRAFFMLIARFIYIIILFQGLEGSQDGLQYKNGHGSGGQRRSLQVGSRASRVGQDAGQALTLTFCLLNATFRERSIAHITYA